jgi:lipoprotein-anchoring transpeptidase ErfK/SrfK
VNRRAFVLAGLAFGVMPAPALAENANTGILYNFKSLFSTGNFQKPNRRYRGKEVVSYRTVEKPGTLVVDTRKRRLFYVLGGGKAIAYGIGVGRQGFTWSGIARVGDKQEWPRWHPPAEMIERELAMYGRLLPEVMEGGPNNPLGARALYLHQGSKDTMFRIHGTNAPDTIGQAVSSGCILMLNEEVIDLYERVAIGTKVIVI